MRTSLSKNLHPAVLLVGVAALLTLLCGCQATQAPAEQSATSKEASDKAIAAGIAAGTAAATTQSLNNSSSQQMMSSGK